jgi:hypothetical protein
VKASAGYVLSAHLLEGARLSYGCCVAWLGSVIVLLSMLDLLFQLGNMDGPTRPPLSSHALTVLATPATDSRGGLSAINWYVPRW